MVDLGAKPDSALIQNGFRAETTHLEGRRGAERASRSSLSLSDCGGDSYSETEPMLETRRLSEDEQEDEEEPRSASALPKESPLAMALQILVPFLLAGFGTVSAGMVLDIVQVLGLDRD